MWGHKYSASIAIVFLLACSSIAFAGSGSFFEDFNNTTYIDLDESHVDVDTVSGQVTLEKYWTSMWSGNYNHSYITVDNRNHKRPSIALDSSNNPSVVWEETAAHIHGN